MIDAYIEGMVERMSPEAPVPVVTVQRRFLRLGGAANVALNIKALGGKATLCSMIGDDGNASAFLQLMKEQDLDMKGIVTSKERITTLKQRILNQDQQMLRLDEEDTCDLSDTEALLLEKSIRSIIAERHPDVIILQDYNKGVLTESLIHEVVALARSNGIPVAVDPKKNNFLAYHDVTLFKPNAKELREGLDVSAESIAELESATAQLQELLHCTYLMTTLSEKGVLMRHYDGKTAHLLHLPAHPRHITDVSGAGDTVLSVASLCLAAGADARHIAALSNIAGGLVCEQVGVVPVDRNRLFEEAQRLSPCDA